MKTNISLSYLKHQWAAEFQWPKERAAISDSSEQHADSIDSSSNMEWKESIGSVRIPQYELEQTRSKNRGQRYTWFLWSMHSFHFLGLSVTPFAFRPNLVLDFWWWCIADCQLTWQISLQFLHFNFCVRCGKITHTRSYNRVAYCDRFRWHI
jgi:hypothetical protein